VRNRTDANIAPRYALAMPDTQMIKSSTPPARSSHTPTLRRHLLRSALPETVRLLTARDARHIQSGFIDDYVALDWLEWRGGSLKLTIVGQNICEQISRRAE